MENNFVQMLASAGHAEHIIDCVQLYFTNIVI